MGQRFPLEAHFCTPGFVRGLAFHGKFAFVGLSKPRYEGLSLDKKLADSDSEPLVRRADHRSRHRSVRALVPHRWPSGAALRSGRGRAHGARFRQQRDSRSHHHDPMEKDGLATRSASDPTGDVYCLPIMLVRSPVSSSLKHVTIRGWPIALPTGISCRRKSPMKRIALGILLSGFVMSGATAAEQTCKAQAEAKKLAGAALNSFMKKVRVRRDGRLRQASR